MAVTLPDAESLGALPAMSGEAPIGRPDATPVAIGAEAIGEGVKNFGAGITKLGQGVEDYKLAQDRLEYEKANSDYVIGKAKLDNDMLTDTDYATQPQRYTDALSKVRDAAAANITAPNLQGRFNAATDGQIGVAGLKQQVSAFHGIARTELANADNDIEQMRQAALQTNDPEQQKSILAGVANRIGALVQNKWLDPVTAQKYVQQFDEKYAIGKVKLLPPDQQITALQGPPTDKEAWLDRTGGVENSTGNPAARAPTSSAMGNFQFINSTWLHEIKTYRPDLANGQSDQQLLALRADPTLSRQMAGHLYDENKSALEGAGLTATPSALYLAHFLGAQGAIATLKADEGTPMSRLVDPSAIQANPSVLGNKTSTSVIAWAASKMGGTQKGQGAPVDYIPEDQRQELLTQAYRLSNAQQEDGVRQLALHKAQAQAASDTQEMQIRQDVYKSNGDPNTQLPSATQIINTPGLTREAQDRLIKFIGEAQGDNKDLKSFGPGWMPLFNQVTAREGDPNRLADPSQLYQHVSNGDLTISGMNMLEKVMTDRRGPNGEASATGLALFKKSAEQQITKANPYMKDPKGDQLTIDFLMSALPAYYDGIAHNKTPAQLLTSTSPDYIGKNIDHYKRNATQIAADLYGANKDDAEAAGASTAKIDTTTPQGLLEAVRSNKLSRAEGEAIALKNGWIRATPAPATPEPAPLVPTSQ